MAKTGYIAFVNRSQLSKCYDRLHPAIKRTAAPHPSTHLRRATYVTITRSIAPRHPISYPYIRTYMPWGAAHDVIKWAWSKFRTRRLSPLFVKILPTPLKTTNHLFAMFTYCGVNIILFHSYNRKVFVTVAKTVVGDSNKIGLCSTELITVTSFVCC